MFRTPKFHYDFVMGLPGAPEFHELIGRHFRSFTDEDLAGGTIPAVLNQFESTLRTSSYMMHLYRRFGQNTFVVGPRVQELFRRTRLDLIQPGMIKPPARAFYVGLADCPWQLWGGDRTELHNLTGIYVSFNKVYQGNQPPPPSKMGQDSPDLHECINILLWGAPNDRSVDAADDVVLWFSISLDKWMGAGQDLEAFFQNHNVMTSGEAFYNPDDMRGSPDDVVDPFLSVTVPERPDVVEAQRECLVNVLRLVLNICLYMESDNPDLDIRDPEDAKAALRKKIASKKSPGKRKKLERQLANLPDTRLVYVGPMFEDLPMPEKRTSSKRTGSTGTHASPVEHGVSPHWQRYWVGSGENRRIKWYLKGMYLRGKGKAARTVTKIRE